MNRYIASTTVSVRRGSTPLIAHNTHYVIYAGTGLARDQSWAQAWESQPSARRSHALPALPPEQPRIQRQRVIGKQTDLAELRVRRIDQPAVN